MSDGRYSTNDEARAIAAAMYIYDTVASNNVTCLAAYGLAAMELMQTLELQLAAACVLLDRALEERGENPNG